MRKLKKKMNYNKKGIGPDPTPDDPVTSEEDRSATTSEAPPDLPGKLSKKYGDKKRKEGEGEGEDKDKEKEKEKEKEKKADKESDEEGGRKKRGRKGGKGSGSD